MIDYNQIEIGYYDEVYRQSKGIQSKWHHLKFKGVHNTLNKYKISSLLDVACGPGTFISTLPEDLPCIGIDIANKQIEFANKNNSTKNHSFQICEATRFPFEDNSFDAITSIEFLEHINDKAIVQMLSESKRCLKPSGILLATTPNYKSLWPLLEIIVSKIGSVDYQEQHINRFVQDRLKLTFEKNGFEIIEIRSYLGLSPFLAKFSWDISEKVFDKEFDFLKVLGNLLMIVARKKND